MGDLQEDKCCLKQNDLMSEFSKRESISPSGLPVPKTQEPSYLNIPSPSETEFLHEVGVQQNSVGDLKGMVHFTW